MSTIIASAAGGTRLWSDTATWDGGVVPTAADDVQLNASSGNVTIDAGAVARSLDCNGFAGTLTHTAGVTLTIGDATAGAGSRALRLAATMTYTLGSATTSAIAFVSTSTTVQTVDFAGRTTGNITFNGTGGSWQYAGTHVTGTTATVTLTAGTLDTNGHTCTWGLFASSNSNTRTLQLHTSAITITGTGTVWNLATTTNLTFDAGTSTITLTGAAPTFAGGGQTYATAVLGAVGATVTITGANTFGNQTLVAGTTIVYPASTTQTFTAFTPLGTGANPITIQSSSPGTAATLSKASGYVEGDYLSIQDSTATGGADWYAGSNSTNVSGNTGWIFTGRTASGTVAVTAVGEFTAYGYTGTCPPVTAYGDGGYGDGPYGWPLTLTYDPVLSRVRVTTYGVGNYATTITVDRSVAGGAWTTVRGGQNLEVGAPDVTVDDYEFVGCADNTYRVRAYDADGDLIDSWECTIATPLSGVWLKSISRPFLNRQISVVDWTDITRDSRAGVFDVVGRSAPIAVTDVRSARRWTMSIYTDTQTQLDELYVILASGEPLFIHSCPGCTDQCDHAANGNADFSCAVPGGYVLVGDVNERRVGPVRIPKHVITMPLTEIAAPGPDVVGATSSWQTVLDNYDTWADLLADLGSWSETLELVGSPSDVVVP